MVRIGGGPRPLGDLAAAGLGPSTSPNGSDASLMWNPIAGRPHAELVAIG